MSLSEPEYIIAIGASAGGLDEINAFFDHTPLDGVSYVIVQHLSASFKSRMVELLAKHSKLVVKEAENGMLVKTNMVYLIPNDKFMTLLKGRLYLKDKEDIPGPHLTINPFFNSLAATCGTKAIGVILSGLGADGTEGVKAIKKAGGMVIARNPDTTKFGSMPSNAIATGMVDFVLEPEEMPQAIEDYVKHQTQIVLDNQEDEKSITAIINLIKERSPHDFSDYKQTTILRRTKRRAAYHHFQSLENYLKFLRETPEEVDILAKEFLINVTSFFRDREAFDIVQSQILPDILGKLSSGEEIKMWVAGCATGEEAYSLAILVAEQCEWDLKDMPVKIFATDVDGAALQYAGKGIYSAGIINDLSPERIEKFFIKEGDRYRVSPLIRKMVIFARHDLVKNPPYCNMDFVSCRNLLIYMTPVLQKRVFTMLLFGLKMNGYLFLGASENPTPIIHNLEAVDKKWRIYKNIKKRQSVAFDTFALPEILDVKRKASFDKKDNFKNGNQGILENMHHELANELDYLLVCVDEDKQVVKSYGDSSKYLHQENFNSDLISLLPKPLAIAFNTLSTRIAKTNEKASFHGIKIRKDDAILKIKLSISPLTDSNGAPKLYMAIFQEDTTYIPTENESLLFDDMVYHDQYTINLEEELKETKEKLHSVYELLDASNENMQSFNEELISANEEMQSTNEEMQSVNEELHTINSDYQLKNKELLELNDDLNNYFRSNINGQLFVNKDLVLMRFSPGTVQQFNLLETDIGRPLSNISSNIKLDTILDDVKAVLAEEIILTKEIETNNGKWYQVMTMPYVQQADNRSNGAIITFNDITALKTAQLELDKKNESLQRINSDLDNFAHTASHDLLGPLGNIELSIGMMNKKITDPELSEYLRIINSSIKKFSSLIKSIGTFAKLESDMTVVEMVDMEKIIVDIEWSLENRIRSSGAVIKCDLEVKHILFSKNNLRSILYNLISNALKFKRDETPLVQINTRKDANYTMLSVADNGKGIEKSGIEKIFALYGRLDQDVEGSGIGLYLTSRIVSAAGGKMTVESKPGKGSKFIIHFKSEG